MISGSPKQLATSDLHEIFFFTAIVDCFVFLFVLSVCLVFGVEYWRRFLKVTRREKKKDFRLIIRLKMFNSNPSTTTTTLFQFLGVALYFTNRGLTL